jgi:7-cyano-7-deazaguanine synthase in queuosine biosynthesis
MAEKHLVLCGDARLTTRNKSWREAAPLRLELGSGKNHLHLKLHHITRRLASQLPEVAIDLVEIATYVYSADQMVTRGGLKEFEYGTKWRRHFRFEIPVRRHDIWSQPKMQELLTQTLGFLSDDDYEFQFSAFKRSPPVDRYLFDDQGMEDSGFEEVILFSGGLDSFGGAVQEILQGQRKVVLVSHRPVSKLYSRQRHLVNDIVAHLPNKALCPLHVAVEVNKSKHFGKDFTQRSRSFLFAGIAAAVAKGLGHNRIRFYENGIISLNLPLSPQAVGGRATRTTHPKVLAGFQEILSLAFGSPFCVENPYLWKTKADILREIKAAGHGKLCAHTSSCTHTKEQTNMFTHCGYCSQCVDRRLSALAAEYGNDEDPKEMYSSDVVTGAREESDLTMVERYLGTCLEIDGLSRADEFVKRFPEVTRVLNHLGKPPAQAASDVFNLFKRHARDICHTLERIVSNSSAQVIRKDYPPNCLLGIAVGRNTSAASASSVVVSDTPAVCPDLPAANDGKLIWNDGTFTVIYQGKPCELRNTKEFAILKRLSVAPGIYLSNDTLRAAVWGEEDIDKNTIQRHVSFLRRRLKESRITGVSIDGKKNKDHYALILS